MTAANGYQAHEEDAHMSSWKARYYSTLGAFGQLGSAALLMVGAAEGAIGAVLAGGMLGVAGLLLWGAGARERGRAESEQEAVLSSSRTDHVLFELQREVAALRADHEVVLRAQLLAHRDPSPELLSAGRRADPPVELVRRTGNTPLPPQ